VRLCASFGELIGLRSVASSHLHFGFK